MNIAETEFRNAIKTILQSDDGLSVESEGTVFVRSLTGKNYAAGVYGYADHATREVQFKSDIDAAISYFCEQRKLHNHGSI